MNSDLKIKIIICRQAFLKLSYRYLHFVHYVILYSSCISSVVFNSILFIPIRTNVHSRLHNNNQRLIKAKRFFKKNYVKLLINKYCCCQSWLWLRVQCSGCVWRARDSCEGPVGGGDAWWEGGLAEWILVDLSSL